ncbi:MAG TPA: hypothetical protein VMF29_01555, partial [Candidatus Edwardsbacteria bacterium]|nr:hypothetical protein [Candidatus Edwardsbacteria bacterium]
PGVYRMNRGPVDAIIVEPAVNRLLKISVILSCRPSYVMINTDNYVNINLTIDATQRFQDWTSAEAGYIASAQGKYHFNDTLCISWEYTYPADSIMCRFKLDGPTELASDSLAHLGEWSEWKAVAADSFKHAAYPVEGKYEMTVQFGNNVDILEEKKVKFTIQP